MAAHPSPTRLIELVIQRTISEKSMRFRKQAFLRFSQSILRVECHKPRFC